MSKSALEAMKTYKVSDRANLHGWTSSRDTLLGRIEAKVDNTNKDNNGVTTNEVVKLIEGKDEGYIWERIVKNYNFIDGAQISNSFIVLMALHNSRDSLSTTQISKKIAVQTKGKIYKVSGALRDSLENRLRKSGYVESKDIPNIKTNHKPIRMTLYSMTPKGKRLLNGWIAFINEVE